MVLQLWSSSDGKRHLPFSRGPYSVGCTDLMTKRDNLVVRCFYPHSEDPEDSRQASSRWPKWYPSREYADGYIRFKTGRWFPMAARLTQWLTHDPYCPILDGAALCRREGGAFPVVVFSHGMGACRTSYSILLADIASNGYFVAAVEHKDGSAAATFTVGEDGRQEWIQDRKLLPGEDEYAVRNAQVDQRVEECKQALELLEGLCDGSEEVDRGQFVFHVPSEEFLSSLKSRLSTEEAVVAGHSFGGATVVKAVMGKAGTRKSAFVHGVAFDSWMYPIRNEVEELAAPWPKDGSEGYPNLLFVNCERFQGEKNLETMGRFERPVAGCSLKSNVVTLRRASHYSPTDVPTIFMGSRAKTPFTLLIGSVPKDELNFPEERKLIACCDLFHGYLDHAVWGKSEPLERFLADYEPFVIHGSDYLKKKKEEEEEESDEGKAQS